MNFIKERKKDGKCKRKKERKEGRTDVEIRMNEFYKRKKKEKWMKINEGIEFLKRDLIKWKKGKEEKMNENR